MGAAKCIRILILQYQTFSFFLFLSLLIFLSIPCQRGLSARCQGDPGESESALAHAAEDCGSHPVPIRLPVPPGSSLGHRSPGCPPWGAGAHVVVAHAGTAGDGGSFHGGGDAVCLTVSEYAWQHFAPLQMCLGHRLLLPELQSWMPHLGMVINQPHNYLLRAMQLEHGTYITVYP